MMNDEMYTNFNLAAGFLLGRMSVEMNANAYKGMWRDRTPAQLMEDINYHVAKLNIAVHNMAKQGDMKRTNELAPKDSVLEYGADVANLCAMLLQNIEFPRPATQPAPLPVANDTDSY